MMRAFVLSGGASLGAIQAGMLAALYEREIAPDLIVATSVGAVNGGFIASRPPTTATASELAEVWLSIDRGDVFPLNALTGFLGFIGKRSSFISDAKLRQLLARHLEFERLEDAPVPLHVVAADVSDGREVLLSQGPVLEAVMASAAIPGVFPPVELNGRLLMDGGVSNNTPISHALELGAHEVYVLPTGYPCDLQQPPRGALAMVLHAMTLLIQQRLVREIDLFRDEANLIVLPPPCPLAVQPIDFSHARELIERGRADSRAFLEGAEGGRVPASMNVNRLRPHVHAGASG